MSYFAQKSTGVSTDASSNIVFNSVTGIVALPGTTGSGTQRLLIRSSNTGTSSLELGESAVSALLLKHFATFDQGALFTSSNAGMQLIIANNLYNASDFGIAVQIDPLLLVWSAANPLTSPNDWVGLQHDQTNGIIKWGTGRLQTLKNGLTRAYGEYTGNETVTTTDATVTTIETIATTTDTVTTVYATVNGISSDGASTGGYIRVATFENDGGSLAQVGSTTSVHTAEDAAGWDVTFATSGTNILLRVTGALATNIRWHSVTKSVTSGIT